MPRRQDIVLLGITLLLIISPFLSTRFALLTVNATTNTAPPLWGFTGAYANYTFSEVSSNHAVDSGWEAYTINEVNLTSDTFNMTTTVYDPAQSYAGRSYVSYGAVFQLNQSLGFSALNTTELASLNQGLLPGAPNENITVITATSVTVKAGTFQADEVAARDNSSLIWVSSYSGLVLKSTLTFTQSNGASSGQTAHLVTELSTTNVPTSEPSVFTNQWLVIGIVGTVVAVVATVVLVLRRHKIETPTPSAPAAAPPSEPSSQSSDPESTMPNS